FFLKLSSARAIAIQTKTTAKPEIDTKTRYTVSAATLLDTKAKIPPSMLTNKDKTGIPFLLVFLKTAGIVPSLLSDQSILVEAYKPELAADTMAVKTTKFMMLAAKGTWIRSNTYTKGL